MFVTDITANNMGRKPKAQHLKKHQKSIGATPAQWEQIQAKADEAGKEVSPFIIEKALK